MPYVGPLKGEAESGLRRRQPTSSSEEAIPMPSFGDGGSQATSHVHVHLSPPTSQVDGNAQSSDQRSMDFRPWNLASASSPAVVPPPPPPPVPVGKDREVLSSRNTRTISTQTDGPRGLTEQQLCELEVLTTASKTPGALHIFPDCHALRNVTSTNRRMFCRYCLMNLRQQGMR